MEPRCYCSISELKIMITALSCSLFGYSAHVPAFSHPLTSPVPCIFFILSTPCHSSPNPQMPSDLTNLPSHLIPTPTCSPVPRSFPHVNHEQFIFCLSLNTLLHILTIIVSIKVSLCIAEKQQKETSKGKRNTLFEPHCLS